MCSQNLGTHKGLSELKCGKKSPTRRELLELDHKYMLHLQIAAVLPRSMNHFLKTNIMLCSCFQIGLDFPSNIFSPGFFPFETNQLLLILFFLMFLSIIVFGPNQLLCWYPPELRHLIIKKTI